MDGRGLGASLWRTECVNHKHGVPTSSGNSGAGLGVRGGGGRPWKAWKVRGKHKFGACASG